VKQELNLYAEYLEYQASYYAVCYSFAGVGFKTWVKHAFTCTFESTAILQVGTAFRIRVFEPRTAG